MLYLYDKALENKFKKVFPRVVYAPVEKFYERYLIGTKTSNGETTTQNIQLPAISLFRTNAEFEASNSITPLTIRNAMYPSGRPLVNKTLFSLNTPITYQVDLWTTTDVDRDDMLKEVLYFLTKYPNIYVEYDGHKYTFPVYVESIDDATDISSFESVGDIYRESLVITVPDAKLMYNEEIDLFKYICLKLEVEGEVPDESNQN